MVDVLLDEFFGNVSCGPCSVTHCPEVIAPVAFFEMGEFVLDEAGGSSFEFLHDLGDGEFWRIFDVHVHMVNAYGSFEDLNVFAVADLDEKFTTSLLDIAFENVIAIFGDPDDMHCEPCEGMTAMPVGIGHSEAC